MVDTGGQLGVRPGVPLKNACTFQRHVDNFAHLIQGDGDTFRRRSREHSIRSFPRRMVPRYGTLPMKCDSSYGICRTWEFIRHCAMPMRLMRSLYLGSEWNLSIDLVILIN
jgi:hypothetical protein